MTTAGRPTWDSAKGSRGKWEGDLSALSKQYSVRDLPAHTKLKVRQEGQGHPDELQNKDFKRVLDEKERRNQQEKTNKQSSALPPNSLGAAIGERRSAIASGGGSDVATVAVAAKRARMSEAIASVSTANLDADDPWEEDYEEDDDEAVGKASKKAAHHHNVDVDEADEELERGGDGDADDDDEEEEEEEDEEALMAELAKIKRERAEETIRLAAERKAAEETIRMENILKGNPLLNATAATSEFKVKRRWDDDVVFKNCARGEIDHAKYGFVNDTLRSEFHKKFMKKYIQ